MLNLTLTCILTTLSAGLILAALWDHRVAAPVLRPAPQARRKPETLGSRNAARSFSEIGK